jgi:hypothetical protein
LFLTRNLGSNWFRVRHEDTDNVRKTPNGIECLDDINCLEEKQNNNRRIKSKGLGADALMDGRGVWEHIFDV